MSHWYQFTDDYQLIKQDPQYQGLQELYPTAPDDAGKKTVAV